MSDAGKICRHLIIQHLSAEKGLLKKFKSNLAKSDSWSTARKYFSKIKDSFSCVLIGISLGSSAPCKATLGRTGREKHLDAPLVFAAG